MNQDSVMLRGYDYLNYNLRNWVVNIRKALAIAEISGNIAIIIDLSQSKVTHYSECFYHLVYECTKETPSEWVELLPSAYPLAFSEILNLGRDCFADFYRENYKIGDIESYLRFCQHAINGVGEPITSLDIARTYQKIASEVGRLGKGVTDSVELISKHNVENEHVLKEESYFQGTDTSCNSAGGYYSSQSKKVEVSRILNPITKVWGLSQESASQIFAYFNADFPPELKNNWSKMQYLMQSSNPDNLLLGKAMVDGFVGLEVSQLFTTKKIIEMPSTEITEVDWQIRDWRGIVCSSLGVVVSDPRGNLVGCYNKEHENANDATKEQLCKAFHINPKDVEWVDWDSPQAQLIKCFNYSKL